MIEQWIHFTSINTTFLGHVSLSCESNGANSLLDYMEYQFGGDYNFEDLYSYQNISNYVYNVYNWKTIFNCF